MRAKGESRERTDMGEGGGGWARNSQVSEEAQNENKEGAGSDPRGIPAERQQEGWEVPASHALQELPIKKAALGSVFFFHLISPNDKMKPSHKRARQALIETNNCLYESTTNSRPNKW